VDINVGTARLTLMINHFKAQDQNSVKSNAKRTEQAQRVAELVNAAEKDGRSAVVMGDLNAPPTSTVVGKTISALLSHPKLTDPYAGFVNKKVDGAWTHYYTPRNEVSRIDYILLSKTLAFDPPDPAKDIVRKGQTTKNTHYPNVPGSRYGTVGPMNTEASDHCPVSVTLTL